MRQTNRFLNPVISGLRQRILAEFLVGPPRVLFRSELARKLGVTPSSLQAPLRSLAEAGILRSAARGREVYYEVNSDNPLLADLRGLLVKSSGIVDVLRDVLLPFGSRIQVAFVFGSFASGSEMHTSDVDLLVVGDVKLSEFAPPLRIAEERLARPVNVVPISVVDFPKRARSDHFLRSVLDKSILLVIGTRDDLDAALGKRAGRKALDESGRTRKSSRRHPKKSG